MVPLYPHASPWPSRCRWITLPSGAWPRKPALLSRLTPGLGSRPANLRAPAVLTLDKALGLLRALKAGAQGELQGGLPGTEWQVVSNHLWEQGSWPTRSPGRPPESPAWQAANADLPMSIPGLLGDRSSDFVRRIGDPGLLLLLAVLAGMVVYHPGVGCPAEAEVLLASAEDRSGSSKDPSVPPGRGNPEDETGSLPWAPRPDFSLASLTTRTGPHQGRLQRPVPAAGILGQSGAAPLHEGSASPPPTRPMPGSTGRAGDPSPSMDRSPRTSPAAKPPGDAHALEPRLRGRRHRAASRRKWAYRAEAGDPRPCS